MQNKPCVRSSEFAETQSVPLPKYVEMFAATIEWEILLTLLSDIPGRIPERPLPETALDPLWSLWGTLFDVAF